jgi:hypothetical protein
MPIREIQRYAALRHTGVNGLSEQRKVLEEHRRALEEQITKLHEAMAMLKAHIEIHQAEHQAVSPSSPPLPRWREQDPHVRRGTLSNFEASRGSAFATASEPEV